MCDRRVNVNAVLCVGCSKWMRQRCSGVKGSLKKVEVVFRCKMCVQRREAYDVAESKKNGVERVDGFWVFRRQIECSRWTSKCGDIDGACGLEEI